MTKLKEVSKPGGLDSRDELLKSRREIFINPLRQTVEKWRNFKDAGIV
jgi:hypothetical protein